MRIGIDLGGTKIEIVALNDEAQQHSSGIPNNGDILYRQRIATPQHDYQATLLAITNLILDTEKHIGQHATIGIGIPGAVSSSTQLIKNANSTCLIGMPLQQDLESALNRPVRLSNDANCFALSEAIDGAGKGHAVVFGVILGTGVGAGITVNQQVINGANSITGEWGHNPLPSPKYDELPGQECYCKKQGCIETYLSGPGAIQRYNAEVLRENQINNLTHPLSFATSPDLIWQRAEKGCSLSQAYCRIYIDRLARSLASVINILDPNIIVLGGGLSNIHSLYEELPKAWGQYIFSDTVNTQLAKAVHGDSSGVRGAAWLWPANYEQSTR
ncbi:ROK family protein [Neptunomonas japonica]|uniref:Fructokinase n=1 Tax=Neptunomonas japonica JAMM 1380 TaxID=1441457 RepID=A0A7R6PR21_9GAMM|nr:ROK family protein [Neptunomonas japonica]BBB28850.1 fructokinase [Neptunomonas japonica JAMM 1380]